MASIRGMVAVTVGVGVLSRPSLILSSVGSGLVGVGSMSNAVGVAVGVEVGVGGKIIVSDVELITGPLVAVGDSGERV